MSKEVKVEIRILDGTPGGKWIWMGKMLESQLESLTVYADELSDIGAGTL